MRLQNEQVQVITITAPVGWVIYNKNGEWVKEDIVYGNSNTTIRISETYNAVSLLFKWQAEAYKELIESH